MAEALKLASIKQPDERVVTYLEALLQRAREGELISFTYVAELCQGDLETGWTEGRDLFMMAGMVARMQHRIQQRLDA